MNGKIGTQAFSVLLAVLLVSVGIVPAVSAQDATGTPTAAGSGEPALGHR